MSDEPRESGTPYRLDPRIFEAMLPYLTERFGNASSLNHVFGQQAQEACEYARAQVAALIHARAAREIVFTSGGIESNLLAIRGTAAAYAGKGRHAITTTAEQASVMAAFRALEEEEYEVTYIRPGRDGRIDPEEIRRAITAQTILISVAAVCGEAGPANPLAEIGAAAKASGVIFHTDATQAAGRIPLDVEAMGIDLLSISGEGVYGPRGVGALYVRGRKPRVRLVPLIDGGGQEEGRRAGTLNVPGIVGLGMACARCTHALKERT